MSKLRNIFFLLLLSVIGCGQALVEFPLSEGPIVTLALPFDGSTGVALNTTVRAVFSKNMDPSTISAKTFTLTQEGVVVPATVSYAGLQATLVPKTPLPTGASLIVTISASVADTEGTPLRTSYVWGFSTREAEDSSAPKVSFTDPADGATGVATNAPIRVAFDEIMDCSTLNVTTVSITDGGSPIAGLVTCAGPTVVFTPTADLSLDTVLTGMISTGARDLAGNGLAATYVWSFRSSPFPAGFTPAVAFTDPVDEATGVAANAKIHAAFNEPMDCATLTAATFTLAHGATPITGVVTCAAANATFTPSAALPADMLLTATITTGAKDLAGTALAADHVWSFRVSDVAVGAAPVVVFTDPLDQAISVETNAKVHVAFNELMDCATLTAATFTVAHGAVAIAGVVTCAGATTTFTPSASLPTDAILTATITAGAKDLSNVALAAKYVWTFRTSGLLVGAGPVVVFTDPLDQATDVETNAKVHVAFSEPMDCATLTAATFTLAHDAVAIAGVVTCAGPNATFTPNASLPTDAILTATITTGARDVSNVPLAVKYVWTFRISGLPVGAGPVVVFTDPADKATGVDANIVLHAAFNEAMDCATLTDTTFTLTQGGLPVAGLVTCAGPTAIFTPSSPLSGSPPTYVATITTGAKNLDGFGLLQDYLWNFETGMKPGIGPVPLGAASSYAILAFNTVTNVNNPGTVVTGDVGISPGAALVGFPPGQIVGVLHAGDAVAADAKLALLAAYNDAAGRLNPAVLPGDLSGLTFAPGLYNNQTSVMISGGNLTLDAQGNGNAVFIFQMGSTLTTNSATQVILSGGAKATNVFWAVGTSATLGTNSIFKGTILAASAITMQTGAVLEGRLLAQAAAVVLDTNLITVPAP